MTNSNNLLIVNISIGTTGTTMENPSSNLREILENKENSIKIMML